MGRALKPSATESLLYGAENLSEDFPRSFAAARCRRHRRCRCRTLLVSGQSKIQGQEIEKSKPDVGGAALQHDEGLDAYDNLEQRVIECAKAGDLARLNEVLDGIRESLGKEWLKSVLGDSCRDSSGRTALDYACSAQNVEIAKVLIESGADFKTSALMAASTNNTIRKPIGFLQPDKVTILSDSNPGHLSLD